MSDAQQELPPEFQTDLASGLNDQTQPRHAEPDDDGLRGPGCIIWTLVMIFGGLIALAIVVLAGAAGWTDGQRIAERNIQSTSAAFAERQLPAIETNVADLNDVLLATRIAFLETQTPGIPQVNALQVTATAVSMNVAATQANSFNDQLSAIEADLARGDTSAAEQRLAFLATQTPGVPNLDAYQATATAYAQITPTITPSPMVEPTATTTPTTSAATGGDTDDGFDLNALLAEAQDQIAFGQLEDAENTLDLIIRLDPDYNTQLVEGLMFEVLTQRARQAYQVDLGSDPTQTGSLAEAVRLTDRAENYGTPSQLDNLLYERDIASLYLNAISAVEANNHGVAIQRLLNVTSYQSTYKGVNLNRLLFNEYVAYGEAFFQFDRNYCRAEQQFTAALQLFNDANVSSRRDTAASLCEQGQQAPPPAQLPPGETAVAPIGVPGT
jgi:hypothetical protein